MSTLTHVQVNGQTIGLRFGMQCAREFIVASIEKRDIFFTKDENEYSNLTEVAISKLIHCAYRNDCSVKDVIPVLTLEDVCNWVEEKILSESLEEIQDILNAWGESQATQKSLAKITTAEEKKSQPQQQTSAEKSLTPSSEYVTENLE